jgi:hypothetical protein
MSPVARREREGKLTKAQAEELSTRISADFGDIRPSYLVIDPVREILNDAAELVRTYRLRGYDAVHLATALAARAAAPSSVSVVFGCRDTTLSGAARLEGFELFSPTTPIPATVTAPIT